MRRHFLLCFCIITPLALSLIVSPLQSDGNLIDCGIETECIGRIPYHQPLVLLNPVRGCSQKSITSFWGDSRDEGKRKHEGMDIFARKGTPVIAPIEGVVVRTGWNFLGGRVVWLESRKTQHAFYFAHLATIDVCVGDRVEKGDAIGTVGSTGNARLTGPHLHFGIYALNRKMAMNREVIWAEQQRG